jgi:hypothetical protein
MSDLSWLLAVAAFVYCFYTLHRNIDSRCDKIDEALTDLWRRIETIERIAISLEETQNEESWRRADHEVLP